MKHFSTFILFFIIATISFAQRVTVNTNPSTAALHLESRPVHNPKKVNAVTPSMGIIAVLKGYATQGVVYSELQKIKEETYTIELLEVIPLDAEFMSKRIEFKGIDDATGKVEKPDRPGVYGVTIKGTELNSPLFINAICESLSDYGYNITNVSSRFGDIAENSIPPEIVVTADLIYFSKDTRGIGYQVSIIVNWSIYDVAQKKIVAKVQSAGYSNTSEPKFNNELSATFRNAVVGLMISPEFQQATKK